MPDQDWWQAQDGGWNASIRGQHCVIDDMGGGSGYQWIAGIGPECRHGYADTLDEAKAAAREAVVDLAGRKAQS